MKRYFKIDFRSFYDLGRVPSYANGEYVPNADMYFTKIRHGEIILDTPIFDHFHLQSFDKKEFWEWKLCDVHSGGWEYPGNSNWYISDKFKILLDKFKIAPLYYFYETRLLYKGEKLKYWIFQFPINPYQNIDFGKSQFQFEQDKQIYSFKSEEDYISFYRKEYRENKRELKEIKNCLKDDFDIAKSTNNDIIVSEKLKIAIEETGIEGFEFSELDYEVVVE